MQLDYQGQSGMLMSMQSPTNHSEMNESDWSPPPSPAAGGGEQMDTGDGGAAPNWAPSDPIEMARRQMDESLSLQGHRLRHNTF